MFEGRILAEIFGGQPPMSYEALADNVAVDHLVKQVLDAVPAPRLAPSQDNRLVEEQAS